MASRAAVHASAYPHSRPPACWPETVRADVVPRWGARSFRPPLTMVAEPVRLAYLWRPLLTDTDDNMVIETAINGRADVLVTLNLRDFGAAKGMFDVVKSNFALRLQPWP